MAWLQVYAYTLLNNENRFGVKKFFNLKNEWKNGYHDNNEKFWSKMAVKMNLRIITKNHEADPEKGYLEKSISKSHGYATAMPTAWELILEMSLI